MKRLLSIWLLGIILIQSTGNCWIIAAFYLNRTRIETTLCVNRFDLIPVCRGSCFLERKLIENESKQERSPDTRYKEITLFCQDAADGLTQYLSSENTTSFCDYRSPYYPHLHIPQILKPPIRACITRYFCFALTISKLPYKYEIQQHC